MSNDFKQTVNLRKKVEQETKAREGAKRARRESRNERERQFKQAKKKKRAEEIDKVYNGDRDDTVTRKDLSQITRPIVVSSQEVMYKRLVIFLGVIVILLVGYWMFLKPKDVPNNSAILNEPVWYAVELVSGERYYGQIADISADPIVIKKVYYNYDQLNKETSGDGSEGDTGNLRLVKRGKETHGPTGEMSLVRVQVKYMEPLAGDSKVLKAILDYEK